MMTSQFIFINPAYSIQDFEDGILWQRGGNQDPTGNGRGWSVLYADSGMVTSGLEIDNIGAKTPASL